MKKKPFANLMENNKAMAALSVVMAAALWVLVAVILDSETTMVVHKVPVNLSYNAAAYQSMGLDVVEEEQYTVDITVVGPRSVVGNLTAADFVVYPQTASISHAGRYDLPLVVSKVNTLMDFSVVTANTTTVNVWFDQIITKTLPVETELLGLSIAEGYLLGKTYTTPGEVQIRGPEKEVEQAVRAVASIQLHGDLTTTVLSAQPLVLYNAEGEVLQNTHITFDYNQVEITVPIMKKEELPVQVQFTGVPHGFNTAYLPYTLSASSVQLAGPASILETLDIIEIGPLELSQFVIGKEYTYELKLPTGFTNLSNVTQVTVTFNTENITSRTVTVSNIQLENIPGNLEVSMQTSQIGTVRLVGDKTQLANLPLQDVTAYVDCTALAASRGQQTVVAHIMAEGADGIFAIGTYTVVVNVTLKE